MKNNNVIDLITMDLNPYSSQLTIDPASRWCGVDNRTQQLFKVLDKQWTIEKETPDFRFLYTGREFNIETGTYYYRARIMDSSIGRFTSKDYLIPFGYKYVNNSPLFFKDKYGLSSIDWESIGMDYAETFWEHYNTTINTLGLNLNCIFGTGINFGADVLFGNINLKLSMYNPTVGTFSFVGTLSLHLGVVVGSVTSGLISAAKNFINQEIDLYRTETPYIPRADYYQIMYSGGLGSEFNKLAY